MSTRRKVIHHLRIGQSVLYKCKPRRRHGLVESRAASIYRVFFTDNGEQMLLHRWQLIGRLR